MLRATHTGAHRVGGRASGRVAPTSHARSGEGRQRPELSSGDGIYKSTNSGGELTDTGLLPDIDYRVLGRGRRRTAAHPQAASRASAPTDGLERSPGRSTHACGSRYPVPSARALKRRVRTHGHSRREIEAASTLSRDGPIRAGRARGACCVIPRRCGGMAPRLPLPVGVRGNRRGVTSWEAG